MSKNAQTTKRWGNLTNEERYASMKLYNHVYDTGIVRVRAIRPLRKSDIKKGWKTEVTEVIDPTFVDGLLVPTSIDAMIKAQDNVVGLSIGKKWYSNYKKKRITEVGHLSSLVEGSIISSMCRASLRSVGTELPIEPSDEPSTDTEDASQSKLDEVNKIMHSYFGEEAANIMKEVETRSSNNGRVFHHHVG